MFDWLQTNWIENLRKKRILLTPSTASTAQSEVIQLKNKYLCSLREIDEMRHRFARQSETHKNHLLVKIVNDFLPVVDSLERAIASDHEQENPWREGFVRTYEQFQAILAKYDVTLVPGLGSPFDPRWHEAISLVQTQEHKAGIVLRVVESGYRRNNQLVRAAKVIVSTQSVP
ncbi:MAG: nucleotide exchange factor GrpE [bacterium]|jgi:molecular chaperone GrpE|nr:nucleotide exchange factor GrpE [bacterium]